jgi:hypothetical protein
MKCAAIFIIIYYIFIDSFSNAELPTNTNCSLSFSNFNGDRLTFKAQEARNDGYTVERLNPNEQKIPLSFVESKIKSPQIKLLGMQRQINELEVKLRGKNELQLNDEIREINRILSQLKVGSEIEDQINQLKLKRKLLTQDRADIYLNKLKLDDYKKKLQIQHEIEDLESPILIEKESNLEKKIVDIDSKILKLTNSANSEELIKSLQRMRTSFIDEKNYFNRNKLELKKLKILRDELWDNLDFEEEAKSIREYTISSPDIILLQEKGIVSTVTIQDKPNSESAAGHFVPSSKRIQIYKSHRGIKATIEHEKVHAKQSAKRQFLRLNNKNELRSHPFLFEICANKEVKKSSNESYDIYDSYQSADEATASRAGAMSSLKEGKKYAARDSLEESNAAIQRNLDAITSAKNSLYGPNNHIENFIVLSDTSEGKAISYIFPVFNGGVEASHTLSFNFIIPEGNKVETFTKLEFLKYLDFVENANNLLLKANEKTLDSIGR